MKKMKSAMPNKASTKPAMKQGKPSPIAAKGTFSGEMKKVQKRAKPKAGKIMSY